MNNKENITIYTSTDGHVNVEVNLEKETLWLDTYKISEIFGKDRSTIQKHIKKIYKDGELEEYGTCAKSAQVQIEGGRKIEREKVLYNLDMILSVGYRVNSKQATSFRIWANSVLKEYLINGYSVNKNLLQERKNLYSQVLKDIKLLAGNNKNISNNDILELIQSFSSTWFNLESYDKQQFPKSGDTRNDIQVSIEELYREINVLKTQLISKNEATELFAQEKQEDSLEGILGNVLQTAFGNDVYPTVEEKSVHFLYFIIKNHPFTDGNKRTAAFSFIWFMNKIGYDFKDKITPETLTVITLLIAESNPKEKEKMIGLVMLILKK